MVKDKFNELYEALKKDESLAGISIKSFNRPDTLPNNETSIVIRPVGPPMQTAHGSNTSLAKTFLYQVNVESKNYVECKELQKKLKRLWKTRDFIKPLVVWMNGFQKSNAM